MDYLFLSTLIHNLIHKIVKSILFICVESYEKKEKLNSNFLFCKKFIIECNSRHASFYSGGFCITYSRSYEALSNNFSHSKRQTLRCNFIDSLLKMSLYYFYFLLLQCPGLIFPSKLPRNLQILTGSYPIAHLREPYTGYLLLLTFICLVLPI